METTIVLRIDGWRWFSPSTPVPSTNKIDHHEIAEILLKVALNLFRVSSNIFHCLKPNFKN
jgi:hypothetical protein